MTFLFLIETPSTTYI